MVALGLLLKWKICTSDGTTGEIGQVSSRNLQLCELMPPSFFCYGTCLQVLFSSRNISHCHHWNLSFHHCFDFYWWPFRHHCSSVMDYGSPPKILFSSVGCKTNESSLLLYLALSLLCLFSRREKTRLTGKNTATGKARH
jgi:hypothetical protein